MVDVMRFEGYIFTRIGTPDPSSKDHYISNGVMVEAKEKVDLPESACIYQRMEDYFGRTKNQS
jgi:hypothetical protein